MLDEAALAKLFRGFIEYVQFGVRQFIRNADSVFQREPIRTCLVTALSPKSFDDFVSCDSLNKVHTLALSPQEFRAQHWESLGQLPQLEKLVGLRLTSLPMKQRDWQAILKDCSFANSLQVLDASCYFEHNFDASLLAKGHAFSSLRELNLEYASLEDDGVLKMLAGNHPNLEKVNLAYTLNLQEHSQILIKALQKLPNLKSIRIGGLNERHPRQRAVLELTSRSKLPIKRRRNRCK